MSRLDEIAPRLARAHRAETLYQERRRHQKQYGYISMEIATEELARSMRRMIRDMRKLDWSAIRITSGYRRP